MSFSDGLNGPSERNVLASEIEAGIQQAISDDGDLKGLISEDGIKYLARRAAERTLDAGGDRNASIREARRVYGVVARELHDASSADRGATVAPTPTPDDEVIRLVEKEHKICGIFPFC